MSSRSTDIYLVISIESTVVNGYALRDESRSRSAPPRGQRGAPNLAVIVDIHANLPALHAALERINELGIERVSCGGDLVGYGPHPNEVCRLIADWDIPTIYGNYDHAIVRDEHDCGCAYITQHDRALGQQSVEWTLAHTDQASKDFMRELPFDLRFAVGDHAVHLVHGSPRTVNEYLFEDKFADKLMLAT